jgi:threonine aldolase
LAEGVARIPGIQIDPAKVQTNIVIFALERISSGDFLEALKKERVLALPVDASRVRMVTHLHVDRAGIQSAIAAVAEVMKAS